MREKSHQFVGYTSHWARRISVFSRLHMHLLSLWFQYGWINPGRERYRSTGFYLREI